VGGKSSNKGSVHVVVVVVRVREEKGKRDRGNDRDDRLPCPAEVRDSSCCRRTVLFVHVTRPSRPSAAITAFPCHSPAELSGDRLSLERS